MTLTVSILQARAKNASEILPFPSRTIPAYRMGLLSKSNVSMGLRLDCRVL